MPNETAEMKKQLGEFIDRIEHLEEEKAGLSADVRSIYANAKSLGYNVSAMRQVIRIRKLERAEAEEEEQQIHLYKQNLGMS